MIFLLAALKRTFTFRHHIVRQPGNNAFLSTFILTSIFSSLWLAIIIFKPNSWVSMTRSRFFFCCFLWLNGLELKNYDLVVAPRQAIVMQFRGSMTSGSLSVGEARDALDLRNVENRVLRRLDFIQRYNNCSDIITITNQAWRSRHTKKRTNQISKFNSNFCTQNEFFGFESCFSRLVNVYKLELNAKWNFQQGINHNIKLGKRKKREK